MAPETNYFNPETFTSGLIDDVDLTISAAVVEEYDFEGKAKHGNACAIHLTLDEDGGESHEQYWPVGQADAWVPTDDGNGFQPVTGKTGINKNAAGAKLIAALVKHGFPKNKFGEGVKALVGYKFHWKQEAKENSEPNESGQKKTILLPTKLVAAPGEKGKKAGAGKAAPASKSESKAADSGNDDAVSQKAVELVQKAVASQKEPLTLDQLSGKVFKLAVTDKSIEKADRQAIVALVQDTDWIEANSGADTFAYDAEGGTVESV